MSSNLERDDQNTETGSTTSNETEAPTIHELSDEQMDAIAAGGVRTTDLPDKGPMGDTPTTSMTPLIP
jgi:hypothetical protein